MIVAGMGCRRGCPETALLSLLREAEARAGAAVTTLAIPSFKDGEAGLLALAQGLGLPLVLVSEAALEAVQGRCPSVSVTAQETVGLASVAEACALAAAGPGGRLVLPKIAAEGATCAIASAL